MVLDPDLAGVFIHEAFGHLSEADDVADNENLKKLMTLGTRFGPDILNVYDSGLESGHRGVAKYDDEGVAMQRTPLIQSGILVGRLHSRESAAKMGEQPTGSARALNYSFPPICRMRATYIEQGETPFEEMIKDIPLGVYAVGAYGGETNGEMFTFTAAEGYMIRDGKIAELVRDVTLTGNLMTTLMNIEMIGNDKQLLDNAGGCGKGAQVPLPTCETHRISALECDYRRCEVMERLIDKAAKRGCAAEVFSSYAVDNTVEVNDNQLKNLKSTESRDTILRHPQRKNRSGFQFQTER